MFNEEWTEKNASVPMVLDKSGRHVLSIELLFYSLRFVTLGVRNFV